MFHVQFNSCLEDLSRRIRFNTACQLYLTNFRMNLFVRGIEQIMGVERENQIVFITATVAYKVGL